MIVYMSCLEITSLNCKAGVSKLWPLDQIQHLTLVFINTVFFGTQLCLNIFYKGFCAIMSELSCYNRKLMASRH